jgi:hypothetical protein
MTAAAVAQIPTATSVTRANTDSGVRGAPGMLRR